MTLEDLIAKAERAKWNSPLGGETVVVLCEHEVEYREVDNAKLEADSDGALFLIQMPCPRASVRA